MKVDRPNAKGSRERPKGKGRNKGPKGGTKLQRETPDGRQICFAWNSAKGCNGQCGRVHVCQICLGNHPRQACAQGKGADAPRDPSRPPG